MTTHHVIIADDHPLFRDALKQTLASSLAGSRLSPRWDRSKSCSTRLPQYANIDLVLLDLKMPGRRGRHPSPGLTGLMYLRSQHPDIPVVIVSASDNPSMIRRCANLGAAGFISKSLPVDKIRASGENHPRRRHLVLR